MKAAAHIRNLIKTEASRLTVLIRRLESEHAKIPEYQAQLDALEAALIEADGDETERESVEVRIPVAKEPRRDVSKESLLAGGKAQQLESSGPSVS